MDQIVKKTKCSGCGACAARCPKDAISMKPNNCGYYYPQVDEAVCVDCGICKKVCPSVSLQPLVYPMDNLAMTARTDDEIMSCASGGAATILSETVIDNGGIVYGCDGTDIRNVHHVRIDKKSELTRLKGSKYVQSYLGNVYHLVREDLKAGLSVLFIGTPCQVAGLKSSLAGKNVEKLYTADLVCHGVPSQQMLNDNIDYYTHKKEELCRVSFREKELGKATSKCDAKFRITYGWFFHNHPYVKNSYRRVPFHRDPYMLGFISGLTFRPNCYECRYACVARCSDLTLSDYWGLALNAGFENGKGVSNILINSTKGRELWNMAKCKSRYKHRDIIEAIQGNGQLQHPSPRHPQHELFVDLYPKVGFKKAVFLCSRKYLLKHQIKEFTRWIKRKTNGAQNV